MNTSPSNRPQQQPRLPRPHFIHILIFATSLVICSLCTITEFFSLPPSDRILNNIINVMILFFTPFLTIFAILYSNAHIDKKLEKLWDDSGISFKGRTLQWSGVKRRLSKMRLYLLILLLILALSSSNLIDSHSVVPPCNPGLYYSSCIIHTGGENTVGLSNGVSAFDIKRKDEQLKLDAVKEYDANNRVAASKSLQKAILRDPTDAEARIDLENLAVMASGPTCSFIVGADITNDPVQWDATLQGAFTSQKHFNQSQDLPNNLKIVLLVANFGGEWASQVIKLIGQAIQNDTQILGVMDWPDNNAPGSDMKSIGEMSLPIILSTTEAENMTGSYPYAFLVAATTEQEGTAAADFLMQKLHPKNVVKVKGIDDPYSGSLVKAFDAAYQTDGSIIPTIEYNVGDEKDMASVLNEALSYHPDLIYFAGHADDIMAFMDNPKAFAAHPDVKVLASDSVYDLPQYPPEANGRLYYTASAFEDMYRYHGVPSPDEIFCEYTTLFSKEPVGENCDQSKIYWRDRASSNTILAIDAMTMLVQAIKIAGYGLLAPKDIKNALMTMLKVGTSFQGLGGCITLGQDRKPINKNVVVLLVDNHSDTQIVYQEGCLTAARSIIMYDKQL